MKQNLQYAETPGITKFAQKTKLFGSRLYGVQYAKSLLIGYLIGIDILQNLLISISSSVIKGLQGLCLAPDGDCLFVYFLKELFTNFFLSL